MGVDACKGEPSVAQATLNAFTNSHSPSLHSPRSLTEIVRSLEITNIGNLGVSIEHVGLSGKAWYALNFLRFIPFS